MSINLNIYYTTKYAYLFHWYSEKTVYFNFRTITLMQAYCTYRSLSLSPSFSFSQQIQFLVLCCCCCSDSFNYLRYNFQSHLFKLHLCIDTIYVHFDYPCLRWKLKVYVWCYFLWLYRFPLTCIVCHHFHFCNFVFWIYRYPLSSFYRFISRCQPTHVKHNWRKKSKKKHNVKCWEAKLFCSLFFFSNCEKCTDVWLCVFALQIKCSFDSHRKYFNSLHWIQFVFYAKFIWHVFFVSLFLSTCSISNYSQSDVPWFHWQCSFHRSLCHTLHFVCVCVCYCHSNVHRFRVHSVQKFIYFAISKQINVFTGNLSLNMFVEP